MLVVDRNVSARDILDDTLDEKVGKTIWKTAITEAEATIRTATITMAGAITAIMGTTGITAAAIIGMARC